MSPNFTANAPILRYGYSTSIYCAPSKFVNPFSSSILSFMVRGRTNGLRSVIIDFSAFECTYPYGSRCAGSPPTIVVLSSSGWAFASAHLVTLPSTSISSGERISGEIYSSYIMLPTL